MRLSPFVVAFFIGAVAQAGAQKEEKPQEEALRILEVGSSQELKWTGVQTPTVSIPLTIGNHGKERLTGIVVQATRFLGAARPAEVTLEGKPSPFEIASLEPGASQTVTLTATLPAAATYRSIVQVRLANVERLRATIEVERSRTAPPIELTNVPAQRTSVWPVSTAGEEVTFAATVMPTGDPVQLGAPFLQGVTYTPKADGTTPSKAAGVQLAPTPGFTVGTGNHDLSLKLTGIQRAGRYDATVRLAGPGYAGKDLALSVYAREPWWLAAGIIALGLLISMGLRTYSGFTRPRLQNERRAATLFNELQQHGSLASGDEQAANLVEHIRRGLTEHWNTLLADGKLTDLTALDVYDLKVRVLPTWIALRKRVTTLRPASVRTIFETKLEAARGVLVDRSADLEKLNAQIAVLDPMHADIDTALRKELTAQIESFTKQLQNDARPEAQSIAGELAKVQTSAPAASLPDAIRQVDVLQRRYFVFLANDLSLRLTSTPPIGVDDAEWRGALAGIALSLARAREAPTGAQAADAFRVGLALFIETAARGLMRRIAKKIAAGAKLTPQYNLVQERLTAIVQEIPSGDLITAWKALDQAERDYRQIVKEESGTLGSDQGPLDALASMAASPADATTGAIDLWGGGAPAEALQRPDAIAMATRRLQGSTWIFVVGILILAILTGLKTLWLDDWVWGGWPAYLAAFLWGVAFDQFGHAGLSALIRR